MRALVLAVLLAGACAREAPHATATATGPDASRPDAPPPPRACLEAGCLPAFRARTIDGVVTTHADLAGKVALVMFWASWCEPCSQEGHGLSEVLRARAPEGFAVLGFSKDAASDADLRVFRDRHALAYPIAKLDAATDAAFGAPPELPTFLLYGRDGRERLRLTGALPAEVLDREISRALAGAARP